MSEKIDVKVPSGTETKPASDIQKADSQQFKTVSEKYADVTLRFLEEHEGTVAPLTPEGEKKLRRKLSLHIMLLVCIINLVLFVSHLAYTESAQKGDD
jgi:hypothetical protein